MSFASAIIGVIVGQGIDFFKTRELKREEQRSQIQERVWVETAEIYRQLYSMRGRIVGTLVTYRFAEIQLSYLEADRVSAQNHQVLALLIAEQRKTVDALAQQVVRDRAELEALLGWVDLAAPAADRRWDHAVQALRHLDPWGPAPLPNSSADLPAWRDAEKARARRGSTAEVNSKFEELLRLIRQNRRELIRNSNSP